MLTIPKDFCFKKSADIAVLGNKLVNKDRPAAAKGKNGALTFLSSQQKAPMGRICGYERKITASSFLSRHRGKAGRRIVC